MGFFSGKKKAGKVVEDPQADTGAQRRQSRRAIVAPGKAADSARHSAARPADKGATKSPSARLRAEQDELRLTSDPAPRPPSKAPITASRPPEFAGGDLAGGTRQGPSRTGDAALLDFLRNKAGLIDDAQVAEIRSAAVRDGEAIDATAVALGFITEEQMVNALTQECWVPHLKVDKYEIRKKALDTIGRDDAMHYGVFPVDKLGSLLTLAMVNPLDAETIRALESKTGLDIKKVVATRSEISQGIEKYYSGQVVAKDTSISFTQDVEPKSVTQMLAKVGSGRSNAVDIPGQRVPTPLPIEANITPEIQDIDDLLAGDETIAPAIIEPAIIEPAVIEPAAIRDAAALSTAALTAPGAEGRDDHQAGLPSLDQMSLDDTSPVQPSRTRTPGRGELDFTIEDASDPQPQALPPREPAREAAKPAAKAPPLAPEFETDDVPAAPVRPTAPAPLPALPAVPPPSTVPPLPAPPAATRDDDLPAIVPPPPRRPPVAASKPSADLPPPAPTPPAPVPQPASAIRPAVTGAPPRPSPPLPIPASPTSAPVAPSRPAAAPPKPATARFTAKADPAKPGISNLIPVMEEEFQHAITHGRSHVFDKWIGLQSRNRIINAVTVENELEPLLRGLYASPLAG